MAEMKAERERIEQQRAESQRMMAELLELKAQLTKQTTAMASPPSSSEEITHNTEDKA